MDNKSLGPFNIHDIFAYLGNGFTLIAVLYILISKYQASKSWTKIIASPILNNTVIRIALIVVISYAMGHVLAHLAYPIYDRFLVTRIFGTPGDQALGKIDRSHTTAKSRIRTWVLYLLGVPDYERALPPEIIAQIEDPMPTGGIPAGAASQHYAVRSSFVTVNEYMPMTRSRVSTFLDIYSYSRNGSMTFLILCIATLVIGGLNDIFWALGFFLIAWIMLGRYLRFLKLYTDEIYLGYAAYKATAAQAVAPAHIPGSVSSPNAASSPSPLSNRDR
jgi:hypothetical protein